VRLEKGDPVAPNKQREKSFTVSVRRSLLVFEGGKIQLAVFGEKRKTDGKKFGREVSLVAGKGGREVVLQRKLKSVLWKDVSGKRLFHVKGGKGKKGVTFVCLPGNFGFSHPSR